MLIGSAWTATLLYSARRFDGTEATALGLVNEVWALADLKAKAIALAEELARMPRFAVKAVLDCVVGFESKSLHESLADQRRAVHANAGTANAREGMMAFIEKRKPVFNQGG